MYPESLDFLSASTFQVNSTVLLWDYGEHIIKIASLLLLLFRKQNLILHWLQLNWIALEQVFQINQSEVGL